MILKLVNLKIMVKNIIGKKIQKCYVFNNFNFKLMTL